MKYITLIALSLALSCSAFSQTEKEQAMPKFDQLPKDGEVKTFHDLEAEYYYQVFEVTGKLVVEGKGQFIDITEFKKGTYFIDYDGKKETLEVE